VQSARRLGVKGQTHKRISYIRSSSFRLLRWAQMSRVSCHGSVGESHPTSAGDMRPSGQVNICFQMRLRHLVGKWEKGYRKRKKE